MTKTCFCIEGWLNKSSKQYWVIWSKLTSIQYTLELYKNTFQKLFCLLKNLRSSDSCLVFLVCSHKHSEHFSHDPIWGICSDRYVILYMILVKVNCEEHVLGFWWKCFSYMLYPCVLWCFTPEVVCLALSPDSFFYWWGWGFETTHCYWSAFGLLL